VTETVIELVLKMRIALAREYATFAPAVVKAGGQCQPINDR
jgi:hypothetical protein